MLFSRRDAGMKILVTGGSGFFGRNIIEQLNSKYEIHAPSRRDLDLLCPEETASYLRANMFDVVVHCATWNATSTSEKDISKVLENNLRMFLSLRRGSSCFGKIIYFGSGAEYCRERWHMQMHEDDIGDFVPIDQYGFSKWLMNDMAKEFLLEPLIINLRCFGVFGKYEDARIRFISNAILKAIDGNPITINQNRFFDYIHIDDLIKILDWFINHDAEYRVYNVCRGTVYSLYELAKKVRDISGKKVDIIVNNPGLGNSYSGNNDRLLREIGDFKFQKIDQSIRRLYEWHLDKK
jgi:UDP-glucose 4-epimerase